MTRRTILLINDDGISSPGIVAAAEALLPLGRVVVAAPLTQQTAMGRAYTGNPEARLEPYDFYAGGVKIEAFSLEASPAAVLRHALLAMPDLCPALVVSGVNYGENIGSNVTGSGTVGAAMEGASRGMPSLAVSLETAIESQRKFTEQDWNASIHFTRLFASGLLNKGMPPGVDVLKVEVPSCATTETPWRMTRLSPHRYYEPRLASPCVSSKRCDTLFAKRSGADDPADSDAYVLRVAKEIAVTPLTLDLTASTPLEIVTAWVDEA